MQSATRSLLMAGLLLCNFGLSQAQKRPLPPYPKSVFTWDDSKPYSDSFVSDDVTIRVIKNQGITVAVAGYDAKDHLVCEIFVLNERENRVDVMPMEFYLTYKDKDNKFQHEFPVPPEKLANKYRGRAKWGNFFRAFAAGMATTTSRTYESGTLNVYGRQGSTTGVYSGTTTTTTSDSAAQRRAAEVNASATASANAKAETVLSNALRANTLFPKTYTVGMVYFDRKKSTIAMLYVVIDGVGYTFPFKGLR